MDNIKISSIAAVALILFGVLQLHLVPAALSGILVFVLARRLGSRLQKRIPEGKARLVAAVLMVILILTLITTLTIILSRIFGSEQNLAGLVTKVGDVLTEMHVILPAALVSYLPQSLIELKESFGILIKEHVKELGIVGKDGLHLLAHILIALAIGVMLSLQRFIPLTKAKPFAAAMRDSLTLLSRAFENVVFSQIKISVINTILTSVFLLIVLPMAGVHLPYSKTLVAITFFAGLLPIIGNLISNTFIVLISLG
jgi:predicted PurR-regulated permease PerM